jgi:hypothetical protein
MTRRSRKLLAGVALLGGTLGFGAGFAGAESTKPQPSHDLVQVPDFDDAPKSTGQPPGSCNSVGGPAETTGALT